MCNSLKIMLLVAVASNRLVLTLPLLLLDSETFPLCPAPSPSLFVCLSDFTSLQIQDRRLTVVRRICGWIVGVKCGNIKNKDATDIPHTKLCCRYTFLMEREREREGVMQGGWWVGVTSCTMQLLFIAYRSYHARTQDC